MTATVVVSGATGGIGRLVAARLADHGFRVCALGRVHGSRYYEACDGRDVVPFTVDLADAGSVAAFLDALRADSNPSPVAGAVLLASPPPVVASMAELPRERLEADLAVSVAGHHQLLAGLVSRHMKQAARGAVLAVLTTALDPDENGPANSSMGGYVTTKAALSTLIKCFAEDYPWLGAGFHSPGFTRTEMLTSFDPRYIELLQSRGQVAEPAAVADDIVARFLALVDEGTP